MSSTNKRNTGLRKLKRQEIEPLRDHFASLMKQGDIAKYQAFCEALQVETRVDLPLGELVNPRIRDLLLIWFMTRSFLPGEITDQHQFGTQGLEGLVHIYDVPLSQALLAATRIGPYRIEIFVPRGWLGPALQAGNAQFDDEEAEDLEDHSPRVSSE